MAKKKDYIGPTKGLVKLVEEVGPLHREEFLIHNANLQFRLDKTQTLPLFNGDQDQEPELGPYMKSRIANPYLGQFFQTLAGGIWGGEETDKTTNCFTMISKSKYAPDITHFEEGIFREVKGVSATESCDLRESQMTKTIGCLLHDFPIENPMFTFSFLRYNVRRPMQFIKFANKTACEDSIVNTMAGNVPFILDLPLGVVMAIYYAGSKFGGDYYCSGSRFNSSVINGLFRDPKKTLEDLRSDSMPGIEPLHPLTRAGVDLKNLEWKRYKLTKPLKVNGVEIGKPLLLHAHWRDHKAWLGSFRDEYKRLEVEIGQTIQEDFLQWFGVNKRENPNEQ